jgi:hypothetical protein
MADTPTAPTAADPGEASRTPEAVDRAEELAAAVMDHMISVVDLAQLDTTITAHFLLVELLAAIEVHAGVDAPTAITNVQHLIAEKVASLRAVAAQDQDGDAPEAVAPGPSAIPAPVAPRVLH